MKIKLPWLFLLSFFSTSVLAQTSYCPASAESNYYTSTSNITLGSINNSPGLGYNNYPGYTDHSNLSASASAGGTLPFSVSVGRYSFPQSYFKIFADFNGDGVFSANELAYSKGPTADTSISGNITIPDSAKPGKVRIRVMQSPYDFSNSCGSIGRFGEVDDYSLNISRAPYCEAQANYTYYAGISTVVFGQINNSTPNTPTPSNPYPAYGDFTSLSTTTNPGDTIPISITSGAPFSATSYIAVYADFNNNGIFEASELSYSTSWKAGNNFTSKTVNGVINVPATAPSGNVRVRVIQSLEPLTSPCGNMGNNGEVEDYTLVISCKVPKPSASSVSVCASSNATLAVTNPLTDLNYSWHSALNGGAQLGSGTTYSTSATTSTTVYLQAQNSPSCVSERTPVNITALNCCSTAFFSVVSAQTYSRQYSDLVLTIKNNQSTSQTFSVSIPSSGANTFSTTAPTSATITLLAGQSTTVRFIGNFPFSDGNYDQVVTIKNATCSLTYKVPVEVRSPLGGTDYFKDISVTPTTFTDSFTIINSGWESGTYKLYSPYSASNTITGSLPIKGQTTISVTTASCADGCKPGRYILFIDIRGGLTKNYWITKQ